METCQNSYIHILCYFHKIKYYTAVKINEGEVFVNTWINLKNKIKDECKLQQDTV